MCKMRCCVAGDICCDDTRAVRCPTLILHGAKDPLVPSFHPQFLQQNIKNSWFADFLCLNFNFLCRHYCHDCAKDVNVIDFVQKARTMTILRLL